MSEAIDWANIVPDSTAEPLAEPEASRRPNLELITELMPGFVLTEEDRQWWKKLPDWRKELYLLPPAGSDEEHIRQINSLGMTVVSYVGGKRTTYRPQYPLA